MSYLILLWTTATAARTYDRQESNNDRLLEGLLVQGFDEQSCISRHQPTSCRKNMTRSPSAHLVRRLREQEAPQRRCGPGTVPYRQAAAELLDHRRNGTGTTTDDDACKYLVLGAVEALKDQAVLCRWGYPLRSLYRRAAATPSVCALSASTPMTSQLLLRALLPVLLFAGVAGGHHRGRAPLLEFHHRFSAPVRWWADARGWPAPGGAAYVATLAAHDRHRALSSAADPPPPLTFSQGNATLKVSKLGL